MGHQRGGIMACRPIFSRSFQQVLPVALGRTFGGILASCLALLKSRNFELEKESKALGRKGWEKQGHGVGRSHTKQTANLC